MSLRLFAVRLVTVALAAAVNKDWSCLSTFEGWVLWKRNKIVSSTHKSHGWKRFGNWNSSSSWWVYYKRGPEWKAMLSGVFIPILGFWLNMANYHEEAQKHTPRSCIPEKIASIRIGSYLALSICVLSPLDVRCGPMSIGIWPPWRKVI